MHQSFSTSMTCPLESQRYWHEVIRANYFPSTLRFQRQEGFQGQLTAWELGEFSLSRLASEGVCYQRERQHLAEDGEEHFLVTIPDHQEVFFTQRGRQVRCSPGGFLLERSDEPYEFSYSNPNVIWVVKVPGKAILQRVGSPDRFCALSIQATSGCGALFVDFTRLLADRLTQLSGVEVLVLSRQFLDLLALALNADGRIPQSSETAIRAAHLQRIQHFIRTHLGDPSLSPQNIAAACGISLRYLHTLFTSSGQTVGQWVKEQRLQACHDTLIRVGSIESIAQVASRWGFSDQAHFCRVFKEHFGCAPSELRARYRS
jgi:AraC-like DNA-binding protein